MSKLVLENKNNLPKGWVETILDELIVKMSNGTTAKQIQEKTKYPVSRIETISNEFVDFVKVRYLNNPTKDIIEKYKIEQGDILFSNINSDIHLGKTAIFYENQTLIHGMNLLLIRPESRIVIPKFLNFYFKYYRNLGKFISIAQHAVNQSSINQTKLKNLDFIIPPINEQKRIVAKIEELFSLIDSTKEVLEKTKILLKQYRQSLLKSAFEGHLTAKWREENKVGNKSVSDILEKTKLEKNNHKTANLESKCEELYSIPETWLWVKVNRLCSKINDGTHFSPPNNLHGDVPYVTAKNIRPNKIDLTNITYISQKIHRDIYTRCNPEKDDVLYTKDGTVGYSAVNPFDFEFSLLSSVSLLKPIKNIIDPYFLSHYLNSPVNFYRITGKMTGTALRRVILERIKEIPIPLAPLTEQKIIVAKIEEGLSFIEKNENLVELLLVQNNSLTKSILKQAFEGKLVPQDPNDESAEILLEKIKQEKQKIISQSKRGKKNDK